MTRYWWVNQGDTFAAEEAEGILWAPQRGRNGRRISHHETMHDVQPGDVIVHNAGSRLRAMSIVTTAAVPSRKPPTLPEDKWGTDGNLVRSIYHVATDPPPVNDIPADLRLEEPKRGGAFDRNGRPNTGYLFQLSERLGHWISETWGHRFEVNASGESPFPTEQLREEVFTGEARDLLRSLVGVDLTTVSGQWNCILGVRPSHVLVATSRSPHGSDVEIADVQAGLDSLRRDGSVEVTVEQLGHRSAFIGAVLLTLQNAEVVDVSPARIALKGHRPGGAGATVWEYGGELERIHQSVTRGEQAKLRRRLIGDADLAKCNICGRLYPARFLVAAHIKRRAVCTDIEKRDLANVAMLACSFGCDLLFELGFISVEEDGTVVASPRTFGSRALNERLRELQGQTCLAYTNRSATYFEWHRRNIFRGI